MSGAASQDTHVAHLFILFIYNARFTFTHSPTIRYIKTRRILLMCLYIYIYIELVSIHIHLSKCIIHKHTAPERRRTWPDESVCVRVCLFHYIIVSVCMLCCNDGWFALLAFHDCTWSALCCYCNSGNCCSSDSVCVCTLLLRARRCSQQFKAKRFGDADGSDNDDDDGDDDVDDETLEEAHRSSCSCMRWWRQAMFFLLQILPPSYVVYIIWIHTQFSCLFSRCVCVCTTSISWCMAVMVYGRHTVARTYTYI